MTDQIEDAEPRSVSWLTRLFRKRVKLTYWLNRDPYVVEICDFKQRDDNCIEFKDYYTKNTTVVKYDKPINYVLEQIK